MAENYGGKEYITREQQLAIATATNVEQRLMARGCPKHIAQICQRMADQDAVEKRNGKRKAVHVPTFSEITDQQNRKRAIAIAATIANDNRKFGL